MPYNPPPPHGKKTDRRPRIVRHGEQLLRKGYALHIDHDRRTAVYRRRRGDGELSIGYRGARQVADELAAEWPEHIICRGNAATKKDKTMPETTMPETTMHIPEERTNAATGSLLPATQTALLKEPWYTAQELSSLTGIKEPRLRALARFVESRGEKSGRSYRTGQALAERLRKLGADVVLAPEFAGVQGRKEQGRKERPKQKHPEQKTAPVEQPSAAEKRSMDSTGAYRAEKLVEPRPAAEGDGHITGVDFPSGSALPAIEIHLSRAEALAGLLAERLLVGDQVEVCDMYLAELVHQDIGRVMDSVRPRIRIPEPPA